MQARRRQPSAAPSAPAVFAAPAARAATPAPLTFSARGVPVIVVDEVCCPFCGLGEDHHHANRGKRPQGENDKSTIQPRRCKCGQRFDLVKER